MQSEWFLSPVQYVLSLAAPTHPYSFTVPFRDMVDAQTRISKEFQPIIDQATPHSGVDENEASYLKEDWRQDFYGSNYGKLLGIKKKYDPAGLLYARKAVGSEPWQEMYDGRLCKIS